MRGPGGRIYGLVAPGYSMAEVVADRLLGGPGAFTGADMSTKLKLLGVDVASFGDAFAAPRARSSSSTPTPSPGVYKKLVISDDGTQPARRRSWSATPRPTPRCARWSAAGIALPDNPEELILPGRAEAPPRSALPDEAQVCSCNNVTRGADRGAVPPTAHARTSPA